MSILKYIFIILPFLAFLFHLIANIRKFKWYELLSKRIIRMIYYLFTLIWSVSVYFFYQNEIFKINILKEYTLNKEICNVLIFFMFILFIALIWDFLFISCKSIKSIIFKDTKITLEEAEEIKLATIAKEEDINFLYDILRIKYVLICEMADFVSSLETCDYSMYQILLKKYANQRKLKKLEIFFYNIDGLEKLKEKYNYNDTDFAKIMFNLDFNGVCMPEKKNEHILFAIIKTQYSENDIIITLHSNNILKDEHLIIQNIITILDLYVTIMYQELELYDLKQKHMIE